MRRAEKCQTQARRACLRFGYAKRKMPRAKGCPFETLWDYAPLTDDLRTRVLALHCDSMGYAIQAGLAWWVWLISVGQNSLSRLSRWNLT